MSTLHNKMYNVISEDSAITYDDLIELIRHIQVLEFDQAVEDFYKANEYPAIEDEDLSYDTFKDNSVEDMVAENKESER